ncbi:MAG TPA: hypothetical protein PKK26_11435 [Candidatus Wallbacteria bacterium]|nr:hypothetical protein [Candidatus Wallbacteria bacterium]
MKIDILKFNVFSAFILSVLLVLFAFLPESLAASETSEVSNQKVKYELPEFLKTINIQRTGEVLFAVKKQMRSVPDLIDSQLKSVLAALLNNPEKLEINFYKPSLSEDHSTIKYETVEVFLKGASFDNLRLDTASIMLKNMELEVYRLFRDGRVKVVSQGEVLANISIIQSDLNSYLVKKSESIKVRKPYARMEKDQLAIGGVFKYGLFVIEFGATGAFKIVDDNKIFFDIKKMSINNMKMSKSFLRTVVDKINPILSLDRFPFKLIMKSIYIKEGRLIFSSE